MNLVQKALYVFSCDLPAFVTWGAYSLLLSKKFPWLPLVLCILSLLISFFQLPFMSKRLERIPVGVDEMALRGVDGMGIVSTAVAYLFLFSVLLPDQDSTIQTCNIIFCVSLVVQFSFSLLSDNAPYDLVYMLKGYSYRTIKIDGVEQILLCKKTVRNKESIQYVLNPFRGLLVHTKLDNKGD